MNDLDSIMGSIIWNKANYYFLILVGMLFLSSGVNSADANLTQDLTAGDAYGNSVLSSYSNFFNDAENSVGAPDGVSADGMGHAGCPRIQGQGGRFA